MTPQGWEDLLKASERRFEATFDQAAVGMSMVAPDGRWLRVNRKICAIVGYAPEELLAKTFQDITHPDDLETDMGQVRRMLAREIDFYSMEKRYIRKNGSIVWVKLTVALVWTPEGNPDYFISVVEDIDARKTAEFELQRSEERLRQRNDELERFDRAAVGRELYMIALKRQVNELSEALGRDAPYNMAAFDAVEVGEP